MENFSIEALIRRVEDYEKMSELHMLHAMAM